MTEIMFWRSHIADYFTLILWTSELMWTLNNFETVLNVLTFLNIKDRILCDFFKNIFLQSTLVGLYKLLHKRFGLESECHISEWAFLTFLIFLLILPTRSSEIGHIANVNWFPEVWLAVKRHVTSHFLTKNCQQNVTRWEN